MKPKILFLTNVHNNSPEEDRYLAQFLRVRFELVVSHPLDCAPFLDSVDGVIIRNIWPTHEYQDKWEDLKGFLRTSGLPIYNPLGFNGDLEGKDYLVTLYDRGYPVIPSVNKIEDVRRLQVSKEYWIKPKRSCDGIGARKLSERELLLERPRGYIIQPFMEFQYEPSFFFVDGQFSHAIYEKHRLLDDRVMAYIPTPEDLRFARRFILWSDLMNGVQRIDAIRLNDGRLLLTEVENFCPYLYIADVDSTSRESFMRAIQESMMRAFENLKVGVVVESRPTQG